MQTSKGDPSGSDNPGYKSGSIGGFKFLSLLIYDRDSLEICRLVLRILHLEPKASLGQAYSCDATLALGFEKLVDLEIGDFAELKLKYIKMQIIFYQ